MNEEAIAIIDRMRAVTISREYGSGGGEIAARLARAWAGKWSTTPLSSGWQASLAPVWRRPRPMMSRAVGLSKRSSPVCKTSIQRTRPMLRQKPFFPARSMA